MSYTANCTSPNWKTESFTIEKDEHIILKKYYESIPMYNWWPIVNMVRKWHSIQYDYTN